MCWTVRAPLFRTSISVKSVIRPTPGLEVVQICYKLYLYNVTAYNYPATLPSTFPSHVKIPANKVTPVSLFISLLNHLHHLCVSDGDFNLNTWLDADGGDLLDDLGWTVQVNEPLVDPHLEAIPGFGSFAAGCFSGGDAQSLERENKPDFRSAY